MRRAQFDFLTHFMSTQRNNRSKRTALYNRWPNNHCQVQYIERTDVERGAPSGQSLRSFHAGKRKNSLPTPTVLRPLSMHSDSKSCCWPINGSMKRLSSSTIKISTDLCSFLRTDYVQTHEEKQVNVDIDRRLSPLQ